MDIFKLGDKILANFRTVTVFLANLDMDFVIIRSISPALAFSIIRWNCGRFSQ